MSLKEIQKKEERAKKIKDKNFKYLKQEKVHNQEKY